MKKALLGIMIVGLVIFTGFSVDAFNVQNAPDSSDLGELQVFTVEEGGFSPIPNVFLILKSEDESIVRFGRTNSNGVRNFYCLPENREYTITAIKIGYETTTIDVDQLYVMYIIRMAPVTIHSGSSNQYF